MEINFLLGEVLQKISVPKTEEVKLKKIAGGVVKKIPGARIGGSLAKGTLIKKTMRDIDIFVVFKNEEDTKKLREILRKKGFCGRVLHGSRDYFQIKKNSVLFEIIPVVKVKKLEDVKNVTDFSLAHVRYIKNRLKKNKKLAEEVKLAKVFCYAQGCYGAESYISGFSGYALELLVIYFSGFAKFLKRIQKKRFIDSEKFFKNELDARKEINASKLQSPLLVVDPTYKYRNVCAGLSEETFEKFLIAAKRFLKNPSKKFFEKKEFDIEEFRKSLKKKKARFVELNFKTDRQEGDIAGTKMRKFFNFLIDELERNQQKIIAKHFEYCGEGQEAGGWLGVKEKKIIEIQGPRTDDKKSVAGFRHARKKIFKKAGHWWVKDEVDIGKIFKKSLLVAGEMGISDFGWKIG